MGDMMDDIITRSNSKRKLSIGVVQVTLDDDKEKNADRPDHKTLIDGETKTSSSSSSSVGRSLSKNGRSFSTRLALLFHSKAFQIAVVGLCCVDGLFVITTLLLEIEVLRLKPSTRRLHIQTAQFVLECSSATIVSLFVLEIPVKIWLFGYKFFIKHYLELIDVVVCIISFTVDIYNITRHLAHKKQQHRMDAHQDGKKYTGDTLAEAAGLLVLFRLWRVVRIVNAIIMSVVTTQEGQMNRMKANLTTAQNRITQLESLIKTHGIEIPPVPAARQLTESL